MKAAQVVSCISLFCCWMITGFSLLFTFDWDKNEKAGMLISICMLAGMLCLFWATKICDLEQILKKGDF